MGRFKHMLKRLLRRVVAVLLHASGLRAAFRPARRGVAVLMFHNVGNPEATDYLPGHMKISEKKLGRLIGLLHRSGYRTMTVGEMIDAFDDGETPSDRVVLTFDDGYRDNHDVLAPVLKQLGAVATVFVQTGPMRGKLNWLHHYFWILHRVGPRRLGEVLAEHVQAAHLKADLLGMAADDGEEEYQLKRVLKYEITPAERDELLAGIFRDVGGDEARLASDVYLRAEDCRALEQAGVEIGAHTVNHPVLSSLEPNEQRKEIEGSLRDLESALGHQAASFAYPFGRTWDYNEETVEILQDLGFRSAFTAMPGLNTPETPRMELHRVAVCEDTSLAEVLCEVDGVFGWLERRGLSLRL